MTNFFVSFLCVILGVIFLVLTWVLKSRVFSWASLMCWFIAAAFCVSQYYWSGDPELGIYTFVFGIFCAIMAFVSIYLPGFDGRGMEPEQDRFGKYNEDLAAHRKQISMRRALGIKKRKY